MKAASSPPGMASATTAAGAAGEEDTGRGTGTTADRGAAAGAGAATGAYELYHNVGVVKLTKRLPTAYHIKG